WTLMKDLSGEHTLSGAVYLYDIDQEAALANQDLGNRLMDCHNKNQWRFKAEPNLEKALRGSDFVIISILPNDFTEMEVDVHAPEQYGIYQSVGDTAGPGGIVRALRTIPIYQGFARAIGQWAPDAWVLNYTNPMTLCTRTLYQEYPSIKAFGCCHEVFGTQKLLREMLISLGKVAGDAITRDQIKTNVMGINHFTWIDQATWGTEDLLPLYRDFCEKHAETGFPVQCEPNHPFSYFESKERVKMDLFLRYGLIAAAGDRHLAEFCPPLWYLDTPDLANSWGFSLTPVAYRIAQRERLKNLSAAYRNGSETMVPEASGEEGIRIFKALMGMGDLVTNVNLPNQGQMPDLPFRAVVETNALFGRDSVRPVLTKGLPAAIRALTMIHVQIQEGLLEAALARDLDKAFAVFLNDPQIARINRAQAAQLFKTMTDKTLPAGSGYMPFTP
ncbi:MAG: alpha-glucosidase/alpha-galactosidase, partial [Spirochaetae bacterium HGW-Spirochaetae-8]